MSIGFRWFTSFFSPRNTFFKCHNCLVTLPYFQGRLWKIKLKKTPYSGIQNSRTCWWCLPVDTEAGVWAIVEIGFYFCLLSATSILSSSPTLPLHFHRAGWKLEWNKDVSNRWRQTSEWKEREREEREWDGDETEDMKAICRFKTQIFTQLFHSTFKKQ